MKFTYETSKDESCSSALGLFSIVKAIQPAGTYGFGASSVSLRMVAVISSGLSGYCKYDVNHHSMVVMQSVQESHSTPED